MLKPKLKLKLKLKLKAKAKAKTKDKAKAKAKAKGKAKNRIIERSRRVAREQQEGSKREKEATKSQRRRVANFC